MLFSSFVMLETFVRKRRGKCDTIASAAGLRNNVLIHMLQLHFQVATLQTYVTVFSRIKSARID